MRLYDKLFVEAHPEAGGKDLRENRNTNRMKVLRAVVEPSQAVAKADENFSVSRLGTLWLIGWAMWLLSRSLIWL